MAQTIKLKRSNTSGSKPTTSNLALGEIALNTKDGLFFLRRYVDGTDGNDTITAYTPEYINEYSSQIDVTVTVDTKTAAHPEYNNGSSNGYLLDGIEGPFLALTPGNTYRFDQSDSSNSGHPFRFYLEADKTTAYTTGVTTNGTAGSSGAYTEIAVSTSTPQVLYYQCSAHSYMGSGSYTEAGTISTSQLQADSVTTAKIAPNAITSAEIAQNSIGSSEIAENTVGSSEIAENSITSVHIATGVVIETDVANNSITSSKIATNAVGSTEIAQNSILTKHIDDNQIGIDQLNVTDGTSGQALTTDGAGTLSFSTVASSLSGASDTDITSPSSGQILVHDGTDSFDNVSISGNATLASDGTLTIATNAITSTMIAQNSILTKHIDDNQIGIDQLNVTDGTSGQVLTTDGAGSLSFSTVSGGSGSQNLFSTVAVSGQSDIVADSTTDTLTVAAGSGISLTTDASTDTLTITATGSGLSANAVTSAYLASNAVLSRHIATDAVGSSELAATGVSAGTYGSSTATPQFTVDTDGRITSVGNVTISSSGGGGSAGLNQVINTYEDTGDGSTVAFDTGTTITSEDLTWVFIDGVYQEKGAYGTSGSTVTFSAAPPNGTSIEILNLSSITTGGAFDHNSFSGNGSTTDFTLANTPDSETDLIVFIDGVYQNNNAFNVSGSTLSFDTAPANGTTVIAYSIGGVVTGKANIVNTFNGDSSTTDFTLSIDPKDEKNTIVFVGGVYQPKATYSISGTTLTFSEAPPTGTGNIEVSISQITTTTQLAADILDGNTFTGSTELTGELTAGEFIGDLRGAILFKAKAGEALSKGDVVYISGISGNTTVVSKADADDSSKMPAFGIMAEDASNNSSATVYTFGTLSDIDTSSFSEGDQLFVSTTAGALTNIAPTGESSAIQKMAQVTRSDASAGSIKIMGAGRSNATPNLDDGDIFIGNGSNQAVTSALSTEVESYLDGGTSTPSFASLNVTTTTTDDSVTITTTEDSSAAAPVVTLKRNSSSPADADYLGQIKFKGENDGDQEVVYAKITGKIEDNTDTTEDGTIEFANVKDGLETITVRLKSDEMQLINSTGLNVGGTSVLSGLTYPTSDGSAGQYLQTDGAGNLSFSTVNSYTDSDVETYLNTSEIYTDASNNRLGILNASPDVSLDVGSATDAIHVPSGTTAQRPTGANGYFRYNTEDAQFEGYADGAWGAIAGSGGASAMQTNNFTGDGVTTAFTLSSSVSSEDNLIVFIEGIYQNKGDYVASGTTITFDTAPVNGRRIVVQHIKSSISGNNTLYTSLTGDGSTTAFTLSGAPGNENNTQVFMDGVYQQKDSYTVSGTTLTFDAAPANNVEIEVMSFTQTTINTPAANSVGVTELNLSDGTNGQVLTTNGSGTLSFSTISGYTDSDVETYLNTSEIYTDATNNRLGIGIASPSYKLHTSGSDAIQAWFQSTHADTCQLQLSTATTNSYARITNNAGTLLYESDITADNANSGHQFKVDGSERMRIDSAGNVGIGTTSPDAVLTTVNSGALTLDSNDGDHSGFGLLIEPPTLTTNTVNSAIGFANSNGRKYAAIGMQTYADPDQNGLNFYVQTTASGSGASLTEAMRIDNDGQVGIGTTPTVKLDVNSGTDNLPAKFTSTDAGSYIMFMDNNATGHYLGTNGNNFLILNTSNVERMRIDSSGNVLVGASSGELRIMNSTTIAGKIGRLSSEMFLANAGTGLRFIGALSSIVPCDGSGANRDNAIDWGYSSVRFDDIYATNGTIQTSDRNEKQDIAELSDAETRVAVAAKGLLRKFRWQSAVEEKGDEARIHFGIIAQDLQDAFTAEGLDASDYAMFISTTWWETQTEVAAVEAVEEVTDEEGNVITEAVEAKDAYTRIDTYNTAEEAPEGATERTRLGVRYSELLAFIIAAI